MRRGLARVWWFLAAAVACGCAGAPFGPGHTPTVPSRGGSVAGYVRDVDGRGLGGVAVTASCQTEMRAVRSDRDGWYDLADVWLAPGPCTVRAGRDDLAVASARVAVVAEITRRLDFMTRGAGG